MYQTNYKQQLHGSQSKNAYLKSVDILNRPMPELYKKENYHIEQSKHSLRENEQLFHDYNNNEKEENYYQKQINLENQHQQQLQQQQQLQEQQSQLEKQNIQHQIQNPNYQSNFLSPEQMDQNNKYSNVYQSKLVDKSQLFQSKNYSWQGAQVLHLYYLRKLYFLLLLQVLFVIGGIYAITQFEPALSFLLDQNHRHKLLVINVSLFFLFQLVGQCMRNILQKTFLPVILFFFITANLILVSFYTYAHIFEKKEEFLNLLIILAGITFQYITLIVISIIQKTNLTLFGMTLTLVSSGLLIFQILLVFTDISYLKTLLMSIFVIIWSYFIILETMTPISYTKHKDSVFMDTSLIYSDIIILFLNTTNILRQAIIKKRSVLDD
ncbi:hypothetical protein PPERSA_08741 [Pseudocohnilembus persalinus]|uniref:Bax inhibitor 1-related n=1 Tax=Pseudocohnilembus persalinus TaxID=266149 RepID=A0A0V0R7G7_PSEPJ|nr:hypothetical protein PPERSA_08741 [Pseudocohnilembus persalinus]|eukprot:KRX10439.1 hypothetical protein PPERSA_08741 [Pseudocohnilembus persalinus]